MNIFDYKLEIINPLTHANWDELVLRSDDYSPFHSSAWARILHKTYDYQPLYFCLIDDNQLKILVPFMVINSWLTGSRAVSLPFTDYCPIILKENINHKDLIKEFIQFGKNEGWKNIEFRHNMFFKSLITSSESFYEHSLNLKLGEEELYKKLRSSTRRNIIKAQNYGVETKIGTTRRDLDEYYRLHCLTRKRQGIPPQPYTFFKNIYNFLLNEKKGFIILASYKDRVISGMIFFTFGKKAIYKFGASSLKYQEMRSNNLVMWNGIKQCLKMECEQLSLGRTDKTNPGLRQFKNGWATTEKIINYYRYSLKNDRYLSENITVSRSALKIIKLLPLSLLKLTGKIAYKHIG